MALAWQEMKEHLETCSHPEHGDQRHIDAVFYACAAENIGRFALERIAAATLGDMAAEREINPALVTGEFVLAFANAARRYPVWFDSLIEKHPNRSAINETALAFTEHWETK